MRVTKSKIKKMKNWFVEYIQERFEETDDLSVLIGRDVIINDLKKKKLSIMMKADLYPDDALLIGFTIQDFAREFGYEGVLIGENFTYNPEDGEMYFGEDAVEKYQEIQYNQVEEEIKREIKLDHLLYKSEGIPC